MKFLLPLLLLFNNAFASTIDSNHRYAWSTNAGWFSFTNIQVNDSNLQGLAWSENLGWIQLDTITINNGQLSGYAWSTNSGWINFNQVSIDSQTGNLQPTKLSNRRTTKMTAKGDPWQSINWISFDCKEFNLR